MSKQPDWKRCFQDLQKIYETVEPKLEKLIEDQNFNTGLRTRVELENYPPHISVLFSIYEGHFLEKEYRKHNEAIAVEVGRIAAEAGLIPASQYYNPVKKKFVYCNQKNHFVLKPDYQKYK